MAGLGAETKGVDASEDDMENTDDAGRIAKNLAKKLGCVVVISGAVDTISDGSKIAYVENGHAMLSGLTGTGCMCSSLIGAFCGASPESIFSAAIAAMVCMGVAGEDAFRAITSESQDNQKRQGSFHVALKDAVSVMDGEFLERQVKMAR
jgi:hydroxyethylthiazole kinase